jgi:hypothetical protein
VENKKVKNAEEHVYNGIKFKSGLEVTAYQMLTEENLNPRYEPCTFSILEGKKFSVPFYDLHNDRKLKKNVWGLNTYKVQAIKYTPDFIFYITDSSGAEKMIVIEAKGFPNDRYAYVKKMFLTHLEKYYPESIFFEVHNQKQLKQAIEIIKSLRQ